MSSVAILIPSLRPHRWDAIREELDGLEVLFLGEEYPSYATAINAGWKLTDADYFFTSDDDTIYSQGWVDKVLAKFTDGVGVVGTNDLHNPFVIRGEHSTHSMFSRSYIEDLGGVIDEGPGSFLHEGYDHNYTDCESIETARARNAFRPCLEAECEHRHWEWGQNDNDDVAKRTRRRWHADWELFMSRRPLWVDRLEVVHELHEPPR